MAIDINYFFTKQRIVKTFFIYFYKEYKISVTSPSFGEYIFFKRYNEFHAL
jgi:hypothetical protein